MILITINGNLQSLKESILNELDELYEINMGKDEFLSPELAVKMADLTGRISREIAVYINRKGQVVEVCVGDSSTVSLPAVDGRRGSVRLAGIRCIHTHPDGDSNLSIIDLNSLISLKLDAMASIGVKDGTADGICVAIPVRDQSGEFNESEIYGPLAVDDRRLDMLLDILYSREREIAQISYSNEQERERAILVGIELPGSGHQDGEKLLDELSELAYTAGALVVQKVLQKRTVKDSAYLVGRGKIEELNLMRQALKADLIIFDDELSGAQIRNIEDTVGVRVIDRTTLILDIFASRACSKEGKLQVELAQLKYRLPRLIGLGSQLSRLGGGIGTRGPGEKKLGVDRRHIKKRISMMERELAEIRKRRGLMRKGRAKRDIPSAALVGYTNVGKSTILNTLCNSNALAENKLFATLDPVTRRLELPGGKEVLLTDTVGFIRKLPHDLIEAFKSTLEEALYADILLHVVDMSSEEAEMQIQVVNNILSGLGAQDKPVILVLNKMDAALTDTRLINYDRFDKVVEVSALKGQGIDSLIAGIADMVRQSTALVELLVPYNAGWVLPYIYDNGNVQAAEYVQNGTLVKAAVKMSKIERLREFIIKEEIDK